MLLRTHCSSGIVPAVGDMNVARPPFWTCSTGLVCEMHHYGSRVLSRARQKVGPLGQGKWLYVSEVGLLM